MTRGIRLAVFFLLIAGCISFVRGQSETPAVPAKIISYAERPSAVYKIGEQIRFNIWVVQPKQKRFMDQKLDQVTILPDVKLDYELTGDGGFRKIGSIISKADAVSIEGSLNRPGFMLLKLTGEVNGVKLTRYAGAGVEMERIVPVTRKPADFEEYWKKEISALRARKPKITVREAPEQMTPDSKYLARVYDVRIEDGDVNATGVLAIPLYPETEKLPAMITFGGASWIGARANIRDAASWNVLQFHMNIHDTVNFIQRKDVASYRRKPGISQYQYLNLADREKYMPRKIFLRIIRCLDYLKSRPEWNGRDLIAAGPSFGGCQAIVAAALDPDVTLCLAGAPAMCDHLGERGQQRAGWPQVLNYSRNRTPPEVAAKAAENSAYFDSVNMASLIRCPSVFSVGFIDTVCPPTSVYAAYNTVPGTAKKILHGTRATHGSSTLPGEPGAFTAYSSTYYREACQGDELLVNRSFDYRAFGRGNFADKLVPLGWYATGKGTFSFAETQKGKPGFHLCLGDNIKIVQNIKNESVQGGKIVFEGKIRGTGRFNLMLTGAATPIIQRFDAKDAVNWQTVRHVYTIPANRTWLGLNLYANGPVEINDVSLKFQK